MREKIKKIKEASLLLLSTKEQQRVQVLTNLAMLLRKEVKQILKENEKDLIQAKEQKLNSAIIDRLNLNPDRIEKMAIAVEAIANFEQVVGIIESQKEHINGLLIKKERIPLGVILMIFESRPNVIIEAAALAIKSSNALILKGGKEAKYSNQVLADILKKSMQSILPENSIDVLDSTDRKSIEELLQMNDLIDLVVPRGGENLIKMVYEKSKIPIIAHYKGVCHLYIDESAPLDNSLEIIINSKLQRPGVCNALETLLIHKGHIKNLENFFNNLSEQGTILYGCKKCMKEFRGLMKREATEEDWHAEYLSPELAVKIVGGVDEAIAHIQKYGSRHTEAILSQDKAHLEKFQKSIDASCIVLNASTRFNDGGELGLGAELGISTSKLHAYGPMGAKEMTTTRFVVSGNNHIRK